MVGALSVLVGCDMTNACCCAVVCVRGVCVFVFLVSCLFTFVYRGAKFPGMFFQNTPRAHVKCPGAPFYAREVMAPPRAFTSIIVCNIYHTM